MADPNIRLLKEAAKLLKPVLGELVFVGGCTTGLLISDEGAGDVRPTVDVDAITDITSYADHTVFSERLRKLGFTEDASEGAPCRWLNGDTKLDVMPLIETFLGFSNRWYEAAHRSSQDYELETDLHIRVVTPPYFCATKIEAFRGRGNGDYRSSDLEDLITIVDGRSELVNELQSAPNDVRSYVADAIARMLRTDEFMNALPGYLLGDAASQSRIGIVLERLKDISKLGQGTPRNSQG